MAWFIPVLTVVSTLATIGTSVYSATQSGKHEEPMLPPPVVPDTGEAAAQAAYAEAQALKKRRGAASTILTGPGGVPGTPSLGKQRLGD